MIAERCYPAGALRRFGVEADLVPPTFTTAALGRAFPRGSGRVLLARADIAPDGLNHKRDNAAILGALGLMSPERAAALVERIIAGTAATSLGACGDLLARAVAALPDGRDLVGAATVLVEALPGDPARAGPRASWQRGPNVEPDFVIDLFAALGA